jgi:hypothetical protein
MKEMYDENQMIGRRFSDYKSNSGRKLRVGYPVDMWLVALLFRVFFGFSYVARTKGRVFTVLWYPIIY